MRPSSTLQSEKPFLGIQDTSYIGTSHLLALHIFFSKQYSQQFAFIALIQLIMSLMIPILASVALATSACIVPDILPNSPVKHGYNFVTIYQDLLTFQVST